MTQTRPLSVGTTLLVTTLSISLIFTSICRADSKPLPPAYDQAAVSKLGERLGSGYGTHVTEHFALVHDGDLQWAQHTGRLLESAYAEFFRAFSEAGFKLDPVGQRMIWVCFPDREEFNDYALDADRLDMSWSQGYYSARTNLVAVIRTDDTYGSPAPKPRPEPTTTSQVANVHPTDSDRPVYYSMDAARATHEAAHQLAFNTGLKKRGVVYPLWASEGLATNFEADAFGRITPGGANSFRLRTLTGAFEHDRLVPIEEFITLSRINPGEDRSISDIYAQCWGFFAFLMEHHQPQLVKYLQRLAVMDKGYRNEWSMRREFVACFGPVSQIEQKWQEHLRRVIDGEE